MEVHLPNREEALALLREHNDDPSLINHALAVEGVMRHMARKFAQDPEVWGVIGLVHDLDYQRYPQEHCKRTKVLLEARNWPPEYVRAVMAHGWGTCTDVEPLTQLEKTLYAVDELAGLLAACAMVRPSRSVSDLEVNSVKKKWKDKRFAAGANREIIDKGAAMLGMTRDELIQEAILGMRDVAGAIGL